CQDHPREWGTGGVATAGGGGADHRQPAGDAAVALLADLDRDRERAQQHGDLPGADRPDQRAAGPAGSHRGEWAAPGRGRAAAGASRGAHRLPAAWCHFTGVVRRTEGCNQRRRRWANRAVSATWWPSLSVSIAATSRGR